MKQVWPLNSRQKHAIAAYCASAALRLEEIPGEWAVTPKYTVGGLPSKPMRYLRDADIRDVERAIVTMVSLPDAELLELRDDYEKRIAQHCVGREVQGFMTPGAVSADAVQKRRAEGEDNR